MHRRTGRAAGFTLIELVIACAIMALLAILSWRGLDALLLTRDRLTSESDDLRAITLAFSQIEDDLVRAYPVKDLLKLSEPAIRIATEGFDGRQSLNLLREANRTGTPVRIQRVSYQVRDGQLVRGFGTWTNLASQGAQAGGGTVQAMFWQPVVSRVASITMRGFVDRRGWLDVINLGPANGNDATGTTAAAKAGEAAEESADKTGQGSLVALASMPRISGVELTLTRTDGMQFVRVYNVRD